MDINHILHIVPSALLAILAARWGFIYSFAVHHNFGALVMICNVKRAINDQIVKWSSVSCLSFVTQWTVNTQF